MLEGQRCYGIPEKSSRKRRWRKRGCLHPASLPCFSPWRSPPSNYIAHSFMSLVPLSLHSNGRSMGQEFCLFGSQLFSCKCSVSIYHMNGTVCVPGIPPDVPCPPSGEGFCFGSCCCPALTTPSTHPPPPGTCQEADWLPLTPSPREGERRFIPIGDGGSCGGGVGSAQLQLQTHPESNLFSLPHPIPCGLAVILSPLDHCGSHLHASRAILLNSRSCHSFA